MPVNDEGYKALKSTMLDKVSMEKGTPIIEHCLRQVAGVQPDMYSKKEIERSIMVATAFWEITRTFPDDLSVQEFNAGLNVYLNNLSTFGAATGEALAIYMTTIEQAMETAHKALMMKAIKEVAEAQTNPNQRKDN